MPYVPHTETDTQEMLSVIGAKSIDELFREIPANLRVAPGALNIPPALDEQRLMAHLTEIAAKNIDCTKLVCFLGAGIYDRYIPSTVSAVISRGEFLTAYTPYQPEASQGYLQTIYEFQTMVSELYGMDLANAFRHSGASVITGSPTSGGRDTNEKSLFMGRSNLPFVVPLPQPANASGAQWELFKDLARIATNKPSYIVSPEPRGELAAPLATFPDDCVVMVPNAFFKPVDEERHFFALGGTGAHPDTLQDYRFLALADPSVFINQMMLADDPANGRTDNLEFAARVVGFLAAEDGRRTRCLFYQNGEIVERFDTLRSMMRPPLPMPNIWAMQEKITDLGNKVIDHFETNDTANKAFVGSGDAERNRRFKFIMEFVLALLCVRAGWYLVKRLWVSRRKPDGPSAVAGGLPPTRQGDRPAGVFDRRQRELLRRNNLFEPIRTLVREMFAEANAPTDAGKKLPKVVISDVVARPDTLREALADLWKIAHGPPRVVTVQRWNLLEPLFERLRTAHAEGKWRFVERE